MRDVIINEAEFSIASNEISRQIFELLRRMKEYDSILDALKFWGIVDQRITANLTATQAELTREVLRLSFAWRQFQPQVKRFLRDVEALDQISF